MISGVCSLYPAPASGFSCSFEHKVEEESHPSHHVPPDEEKADPCSRDKDRAEQIKEIIERGIGKNRIKSDIRISEVGIYQSDDADDYPDPSRKNEAECCKIKSKDYYADRQQERKNYGSPCDSKRYAEKSDKDSR